ncbi:unnamed protein product [Spirodela intermedia]|uniref:dCTP pyrophosphatase 1 n=1 Tax=Spirodela intermedia TaxID=51605 RepID=A0A7I8JEW0_SPIIN|nr:unnamed protein product [Spirodela intermedia]CAA6667942.1 unnamed protein product [Spirodela intermedia]
MEAVTLEELRKRLADFAKERDWDKFHSPRNLLLAMGAAGVEEGEREHLGEEISDVLLYLVRLADICGIDLSRAALRKLDLNAIKYPVPHCQGSSRKHTDYAALSTSGAAAADGGESSHDDCDGSVAS